MSQFVIDDHIANYDEAGYVVPEMLLDWPAHGDVTLGADFYLAPFVDTDGNGMYNPENGDYPRIKGDYATFIILNDKGDVHESGAEPIGIEIHFLVYQYATDDVLNETTFINLRAINRGTQTLYGFRTACFSDPDVGTPEDDYVGSNPEMNYAYAYNGDLFDDGAGPAPGYGEDVPAVGVLLLNKEAYAIGATSSGAAVLSSPASIYNFMGGLYPSGIPFINPLTDEASKFMYNGSPAEEDSWTEFNVGNPPSDRRMMISTDEDVFSPGEIICLDYAIIFNREGGLFESAIGLEDVAEEVQSFYDGQLPYCMGGTVGIEKEKRNNGFSVYPNPSIGQFTLEMNGAYDLKIYAMDGRLVYQQKQLNDTQFIDASLASGQYMVEVIQADTRIQKKLIIQ